MPALVYRVDSLGDAARNRGGAGAGDAALNDVAAGKVQLAIVGNIGVVAVKRYVVKVQRAVLIHGKGRIKVGDFTLTPVDLQGKVVGDRDTVIAIAGQGMAVHAEIHFF